MDKVLLSDIALEGHLNAGMRPKEIAKMYNITTQQVVRRVAVLIIKKTR